MIIGIGTNVPLSVYLTKNLQPLSGETITVRVIRDDNAVELLTSTVVPETSEPAYYLFVWTGQPTREVNLTAIFTVRNRTYTEQIEIFQGGISGNAIEIEVTQPKVDIVDKDQKTSVELRQSNVVAESKQDTINIDTDLEKVEVLT